MSPPVSVFGEPDGACTSRWWRKVYMYICEAIYDKKGSFEKLYLFSSILEESYCVDSVLKDAFLFFLFGVSLLLFIFKFIHVLRRKFRDD